MTTIASPPRRDRCAAGRPSSVKDSGAPQLSSSPPAIVAFDDVAQGHTTAPPRDVFHHGGPFPARRGSGEGKSRDGGRSA